MNLIGNFENWYPNSHFHFQEDGKHSVLFDTDFPFMIQFQEFSHHFQLTPSYHEYFEIVYFYEGNGLFSIEGKDYQVKKDDVLIIGNTEFHVLKAKNNTSLKLITMYFLPELIYQPGFNFLDFEYLGPFFDHSKDFTHCISNKAKISEEILSNLHKIFNELKEENNKHCHLYVKTYLQDILLLLIKYYGEKETNQNDYLRKKDNISRLDEVFSYLRDHYSENISLKQVSQIACMSKPYFCKFFKSVTSYSFIDYVMRLRIDKAKELISRKNLSITEASFESGFNNPTYFNRVFKRLNSMSPSEYRKLTN